MAPNMGHKAKESETKETNNTKRLEAKEPEMKEVKEANCTITVGLCCYHTSIGLIIQVTTFFLTIAKPTLSLSPFIIIIVPSSL